MRPAMLGILALVPLMFGTGFVRANAPDWRLAQ